MILWISHLNLWHAFFNRSVIYICKLSELIQEIQNSQHHSIMSGLWITWFNRFAFKCDENIVFMNDNLCMCRVKFLPMNEFSCKVTPFRICLTFLKQIIHDVSRVKCKCTQIFFSGQNINNLQWSVRWMIPRSGTHSTDDKGASYELIFIKTINKCD